MSTHTAADSAPASARILRTAASALERFRPFSTFCSAISMYVFLGMVALTFLDVVLRTTIDRPISGTIEITELLMVVMFFGSVAHAQWNHAHVNMDIITSRLSKTGENRLGFATDLWSLVIVVFCIKTMIDYAFKSSTLVTPTWHIHFLPFILYAAAGCALIVIALLHDVLTRLADALERDSAAGVCAMLCLALIPLALGILFAMHRTPLSQAIPVGILGLVYMFALFFMGMPIAYALMAAAFIFICTLRGPGGAFNLLGKTWFTTVASYNWSPLMFFLLMGYLCFYSQFGQDLFRCFRAWMGHARGGLAHGSVAACTAFGAVVGDNVACNVAMTTIALPEMRRNGYDDSLSVGTLAASGTIGSLIPPSTSFIIYGVLADQSIGDLFMAGVLPGITCMLCFMLVIWYRVWRNPALGPASPAVSGTEKAKSLIMALPILLIFVVAIGGIYAGLFTATEGGGIGAFATLAFALALRRFTWKSFSEALTSTSKAIIVCFAILCGANLFGYFVTMSRIPLELATWISTMHLGEYWVMFAIIVVMSFLGCFIPNTPLILICIPMFLPIANAFHWDLIWFGVIMVLLKNMAGITPPFGISLFVVKGLADIPLTLMFRAILPFVIGLYLCLALIIAFPPLSTWLPGLMH